MAGLSGCGMHQLGRVLFGLDKLTEGKVQAFRPDGTEVTVRSVQDALDSSIGYISKDRDKEALVLPASIKDNLVLANLNRMGTFILPKKEREHAKEQIESLAIKCSSMNQAVGELSGGNKQKVVLARWVGKDSDLIILDSPTRGIDVKVKADIYAMMNDMRKKFFE